MSGKFAYYVKWAFGKVFLKKRVPLDSSLILTDACNLRCRHCTVAHLGYPARTLEDVMRDVRMLYDAGSRVLIVTGGEPFVWKDAAGRGLEDVVKLSKDMGFFRVVVCTNGTFPLESSADFLWVSLDGFEAEHERIRGGVYDTVVKHVVRSSHPRIYVNFTVSTENYRDFDAAAENILGIANVKGILFHLYTKYLGGDASLELSPEQRRDVIGRMTAFKRRHPAATFNTFAGLRALRKDNWQRRSWASVTVDRGNLTDCCCREGIADDEVCRNCGCTPAVETWVLQTFKLSAVIENLKYL